MLDKITMSERENNMKRVSFVLMFFLIFTSFMSLDAQWAKTYEGPGYNRAYAVQQTTDGGYIAAAGSMQIKLYFNGDIEWHRSYGGSYYSIQQTTDGGYIAAGSTESDGLEDMCVLKLDSNGVDEWCYKYCREPYDVDRVNSIQQTSDGGYIAAGRTDSPSVGGGIDFWILKFTSDGGIEWQKTYDRSGWDVAYSIQQTTDGGYIVAGESMLIKLYFNGDIEWQRTYGGSFYSIQQTTDGGYIAAGSTSIGALKPDFFVLKLDNNGDIEWQYAYGGDDYDIAHSIQQTSDEGYIVAGYTQSFETRRSDFFVLKLYFNGDIEWQRTYGGSNSDKAHSIQQTTDGGYIVVGSTSSYDDNFWVLKLDSNGNIHSSCEFIKIPDVIVTHTSIIPEDTDIIPQDVDLTSVSSFRKYNERNVTITHLCPIANDKDPIANDKEKFCFIATAAYDSPLHPHVKILRDFRDKYLMPNKPSRTLVYFYYKYSPSMASFIAKHEALKVLVRVSLLPLVAFSYSFLHFGPIITAVMLLFTFGLPIFPILFFRRKMRRAEAKSPKALASLD
jgi:hypothetical protein